MPIATEQVKCRIRNLGLTVREVSSELNIDESTYYRKMAGNGSTFTIGQVQKLASLLNLSKQEAREIFLP